MVDKRIEQAKEIADDAKEQTKVLCPWLPNPHKCPACDTYCDATEDFVREQAMVVDIWHCPDCGERYYRNRE
jgi:hypothetical protein